MEWVENIVGKGENAGYQHFFLFPRFQKLSISLLKGCIKSGMCGTDLRLYHAFLIFIDQRRQPYETFVGKGENAGNF